MCRDEMCMGNESCRVVGRPRKLRRGRGMTATGAGCGDPLEGIVGFVPFPFQSLVNGNDWSASAVKVLV